MKLQKKKKQEKRKQAEESNQPNQLDMKPSFWDVVAPEGMAIRQEDYDFGVIKQSLGSKTYFRPFYIPKDGYPRKLQTNWLYSLTSSGECDVLIKVHKIPKSDSIKMLQNQITMLKSNLNFQTKRGNIDQVNDLQTKIFDTEQLMAETQFSENDSYHVAVTGMLYAQSEKELNNYSEYVEDELTSMFFKVTSAWSRVKKGFRTVLPLGNNELKDALRNIDRRALSTFSPFISGSGRFNGGVPLGINKITGQKEFYNAFGTKEIRPDNYNMFVSGTSGSGKSLAIKLLLARETTGMGVYTRLIDVEGEFVKIVKRLGGMNLNISEESNIRINPLALNVTNIPLDEDDEELEILEDGDEKEIFEKDGKKYISFVPLREKLNEALDFFDIVCRGKNGEEGGLDVFERNYLEEAIYHIFEEFEFTTHPSSLYENSVKEIDGQLIQSRARKPEPTISDIYNYLLKVYGEEPKAERLIAAIRPFLRDGSKPIFDGQTYLGKNMTQALHNARLVNFNISGMEEGFLRPIAYHVILNYVWEYFVKNVDNASKKKIVLADEAWTLVDSEQTVDFLEKVARRARKRNCGLRLASQDFVRFIESKKARGILQNTYTFFFLKQNKIDLASIKTNFDLSAGERSILFGNPDKGEGIIRSGKSSTWLRTDPSEEELAFVESNQAVLDELLERKRRQRDF